MSDATIIDGKAFAAGLREKVAAAVTSLKDRHGLEARLDVVLVGDDPASHVYVRNKGKQTEEAGMVSVEHRLAVDATKSLTRDRCTLPFIYVHSLQADFEINQCRLLHE